MSTVLEDMIGLLDLRQTHDTVFEADHSELARRSGHVFGGLVAAQAFVAAARTVEAGRPAHSLHAYFLRPGDPTYPIELRVDVTRDGRSFSHRRVSAVQRGAVIMEMSSSWAVGEPGLSHQLDLPVVAAPEDLASDVDVIAELATIDHAVLSAGAFDVRTVGTHSVLARATDERTDRSTMWMRASGEVPEDPVLHAALLVYASDITVLDPTTRPHGRSMLTRDVLATTIDHAVWLHAAARVDDWFLVDVDSPWAGGGRGFARGRIFARSGLLVAEVAQEGLIRLPGQSRTP